MDAEMAYWCKWALAAVVYSVAVIAACAFFYGAGAMRELEAKDGSDAESGVSK